MSKFLITGGEGFIGSKIVRETGGVSYDIKSGFDILHKGQLEKLVLDKKGIFHCAAKISVPESFLLKDEYYKTNVLGTGIVVGVAEKNKSKIVFSSSASVYGEASGAVDEKFSLDPKSPYAENKVDGEKILQNSSIPHIALRPFNIYGPGQSPQYAGVITHFIINAIKGDDLVICGDGNQIRDFVFVDDVIRANILAMNYENKSYEVFNIGSGKETSIKMLAETIIKLLNSPSKIIYKAARAGDIVFSLADVSKARRILNWEAMVLLEDGLKETIGYYKS